MELEKKITSKYNTPDNEVDIPITSHLAFLAVIKLQELDQIFRIYYQFETKENKLRWIGYTNLYPCDYIIPSKENAVENTQGINLPNTKNVVIFENINTAIKNRFPLLREAPTRIIRIRCRADKEIEKDIEFNYSIVENKL